MQMGKGPNGTEITSQIMSAIVGEIIPCPLVSCSPDLRYQTSADGVNSRADKKSMVAVVKGTSTLNTHGGVTVVETVEVLASGKMSSEELGDQGGVMTGVGRCPR